MSQLAIRLFAPGLATLLVGLGVAAYLGLPILLEASWIGEARAVHDEWRRTGRVAGATVLGGPTYLTQLRVLGAPPHIPDLSDGFLTLERVVRIPPRAGRREALHAGYVSRHGCRLSLWMSRAAGDDEPAARAGAYGWTADGLRYVVAAEGFPEGRLDVLAGVVYRFTQDGAARSPADGRSLGLSAALNPPCEP